MYIDKIAKNEPIIGSSLKRERCKAERDRYCKPAIEALETVAENSK